MFISNAYAQATGGVMEGLTSFLPIVLMFVVLYFLMIRPQMKRQKDHKALIAAVSRGDEVVTVGGILGTVSKVGDVYVTVAIGDNTEVMLQKSSISALLPKGTLKSL